MKKFKVAVTEIRRKVVTVRALDEKGAHQRVYDAWSNTEFMLGDDDFEGAEFHVIGEGVEGEKVESKGGTL